jgi:hypothetical protein
MGRVASSVLSRHDIAHVQMVHPAARGRIRKKERYAAHVQEVLKCCRP